MDEYTETILEHNISCLIEDQFPNWYKEHGGMLVAFVKEYYKWLEGSQTVANTEFIGKGYVTTNAKNNTVQGFNTDFTSFFVAGDTMAIYKQDSHEDYDLVRIESVVNSSVITVLSNTLPEFSSSNSWFTTTYVESNPNYYLRRYLEKKDVDLTSEDFLVYFKEKYLKNIQFETKASIVTLLKHSLDIYRSKGTERSLDLMFRAIFGVPATVYYPGDDIFKLSDGKWYKPTYLEISLKRDAEKLVGKQIVGSTSKAIGFAEALVRRIVKGRLVDILYISAVNGNFVVDELINSASKILTPADCPTIIGSLTNAVVSIDGTGANYEVGDIVDIYSDYGEQAKGKIQGISNTTGQVIFELVNGGYGYREESEVLVSSKILTVSNLRLDTDNNGKNYVYMFDTMVQPLANILYGNITSNLVAGDMLYTYDGGNVLSGTGQVILSSPTDATHGTLLVSVLDGSLNFASLYTAANTKTVTKNVYSNATCTANVIGYYANTVADIVSKTGNFTTAEEVYQTDNYDIEIANGQLTLYSLKTASSGELKISNTYGVFRKDRLIKGRVSGASANLQNTAIYVGVTSISNTFYVYDNNYVYFTNSLSNGTITNISLGTLANVAFSNSLLYTETVSLANDDIIDHIATEIDAATYNFPTFPSGNLTFGTLAQMFANQSYTVGKVQQLTGINKGMDYNLAPIVRFYDKAISHRYKQDLILNITGLERLFTVGEVISQVIPNSRGIVKMANSSQIWVEQLRLNDANSFVVTANVNTVVLGSQSLATANITSIDVDNRSEYLGFNANIDTEVIASQGAVTNLAIVSSGFGYLKNDSLRFVPTGDTFDSPDAGFGFANILNQGYGAGYYKRKGGWLSDQSRLFDGIYYQEYSYEVRSSITLIKYEEMLKQILHVAGTKYFGALVYRSYVQTNTAVGSTHITSGS